MRIARVNNQFIVQPTAADMDASDMDMLLAGTDDAVEHESKLAAVKLPRASCSKPSESLPPWRGFAKSPA